MADEIAKAVEDGAERIGKSVGGDFARAYQDLLHDTGTKLTKVADNHATNESRITDDLNGIRRDDDPITATRGSSRINTTLGGDAPTPPYSGDPAFRSSDADRAAFRSQYSNYDDEAAAVRGIVANHPELQGIPEEDLVGIRGYTTNDYYGNMNEAMRNGDPAGLSTYDPHIRTATSGLNQLPPYRGEVGRGINPPDPDAVAARYEPGKTVTEDQFTSTDTRQAFPGNVQFTIDSKAGKDISNLSVYGGVGPESEVLFPPGSQFNVVSRTQDPSTGQWHIHLDEVG